MTEVLEQFVNSNKEALVKIYNTEKDKLNTEYVLLINHEKIKDIKVTIGAVITLDDPINTLEMMPAPVPIIKPWYL